jgi:demethylmenaquinone methyltransferase/2-methoxy-6-polyprenyl-1,4-benzoquinol methylase
MKESSRIKQMFDEIVESYDFLNHTLSFFQDYYWRRRMTTELLPFNCGLVMDLATGTGDSALGILKSGSKVVGVDLSFKMLSETKKKIFTADFMPATASAYELPFLESTFDAVTCAFGIRNMHETQDALNEIFRIIKKGGVVVFLEFSLPRGFIKIPYSLYLRHIMPNIARMFSKKEAYDYLWESIEKFPTPEKFSEQILNAGFSCCQYTSLSMGCVHIHKAFKL